jgi:hypothetical protein
MNINQLLRGMAAALRWKAKTPAVALRSGFIINLQLPEPVFLCDMWHP